VGRQTHETDVVCSTFFLRIQALGPLKAVLSAIKGLRHHVSRLQRGRPARRRYLFRQSPGLVRGHWQDRRKIRRFGGVGRLRDQGPGDASLTCRQWRPGDSLARPGSPQATSLGCAWSPSTGSRQAGRNDEPRDPGPGQGRWVWPSARGVVKDRSNALYHRGRLLSIGQFIGVFWEIGRRFGIIWDMGSDNGGNERARDG
jgi:hypothetical protein